MFAGFDRIVVDPEILSGKRASAHVRGTRIGVSRALEVLAQYSDRETLRSDYPPAARMNLFLASSFAVTRHVPMAAAVASRARGARP